MFCMEINCTWYEIKLHTVTLIKVMFVSRHFRTNLYRLVTGQTIASNCSLAGLVSGHSDCPYRFPKACSHSKNKKAK
jgi:hypothetical protein